VRKRIIKLAAVISIMTGAFFVCVNTAVCWSRYGTSDVAAQNFDKVNEKMYRGGIPSASDLLKLKAMGIQCIVDFTVTRDDEEKEIVEGLGMKYVNIPWESPVLKARSYDYFDVAGQFLNVVHDEDNAPLFVHCENGRSRTGVMIAVYRIDEYGWNVTEVLSEMEQYGFNRIKRFNLWQFLNKYARSLDDKADVT